MWSIHRAVYLCGLTAGTAMTAGAERTVGDCQDCIYFGIVGTGGKIFGALMTLYRIRNPLILSIMGEMGAWSRGGRRLRIKLGILNPRRHLHSYFRSVVEIAICLFLQGIRLQLLSES